MMKQVTIDLRSMSLVEVQITEKDLARLRVTKKTFKGGKKHDCSSCQKCKRKQER